MRSRFRWLLLSMTVGVFGCREAPVEPTEFMLPAPRADVLPITWDDWVYMQAVTDWYIQNYNLGGACSEAIGEFWSRFAGTFTYEDWPYQAITDHDSGFILMNRQAWGQHVSIDAELMFHEAWHVWYPNAVEGSAVSFAQGCLGQ